MNSPALSHTDVENAYTRWAPVYDWAFALVMRPGRRAAAARINAVGGKILDVGVGTGLELPMFADNVRITGIDLCEPMLDIARKRVADLGLKNVDELRVMDAMNLDYADESFDVVVAPYVLTVVPDPERMLNEMARVVKPGGEMILVNHIGAERGPIALIEAWLGRKAATLGWDPRFPWSVLGNWIDRRPDVDLLERRTLAPIGLFTMARLRRR